MEFRPVAYDHPDAVKLNADVQLEYAERYGEGDLTPLDPAMFTPPQGLYLIAYDDEGFPVATGGWRTQQAGEENYADGDAELKRMYVVPAARGKALARRMLALLEADALAAGRTRMVLETGTEQPEAVALYLSTGYTAVPLTDRFGLYRHTDESRCFTKPLV
ncbi:N-acetyltransferase [Streptomyces spiroverticillatus]|uniref:N-acetyltransferase n=1 Tax=Streptomyces finlayi TaxID=67296 RepID=A0A918X1C8_9ACTN|nr:GNAT family N-acetyltransferase [Streptomyces finlayi]GHA19453.1 N-acetyltransferase [Streptomyces spiroverticillatus]GHD02434.1 N-acetyltransferase [Streptomyces finlayi]